MDQLIVLFLLEPCCCGLRNNIANLALCDELVLAGGGPGGRRPPGITFQQVTFISVGVLSRTPCQQQPRNTIISINITLTRAVIAAHTPIYVP